jgi:hypothetical protein
VRRIAENLGTPNVGHVRMSPFSISFCIGGVCSSPVAIDTLFDMSLTLCGDDDALEDKHKDSEIAIHCMLAGPPTEQKQTERRYATTFAIESMHNDRLFSCCCR